jgi:hypothetical protein
MLPRRLDAREATDTDTDADAGLLALLPIMPLVGVGAAADGCECTEGREGAGECCCGVASCCGTLLRRDEAAEEATEGAGDCVWAGAMACSWLLR